MDKAQGLPPRMSPNDYQSRMMIGKVALAAEFDRHAVPTAEEALNTEDYVVVETALYGPPGGRLVISLDDFSLRINGKKNVLSAEPYGAVVASLKDPEYEPPEAKAAKEAKSKTSIGGGGGDQQSGSPPPVIHIPLEKQRSMTQHTQKASLPLGDRALPQAGLLFFKYRGKADRLDSVELMYNGPAGKGKLDLRP
ncbi:MAG TPA: hypothetical protein VGS58_20695 [Candidatus Sulfopaludibacter sp.]|nr:hypothetical protein [Candidatus Sulfopaludibacter sp.]